MTSSRNCCPASETSYFGTGVDPKTYETLSLPLNKSGALSTTRQRENEVLQIMTTNRYNVQTPTLTTNEAIIAATQLAAHGEITAEMATVRITLSIGTIPPIP